MKESEILKHVMLAASESGVTVFRNNVGIAFQPNGQVIKYGLCKGSSDLIGWRPITITQNMVGTTLAQFVAIETKTTKGRATPEQLNFLNQLAKSGGAAILTTSAADTKQQLSKDPSHE